MVDRAYMPKLTAEANRRWNKVALTLDTFQQGRRVLRSGVQRITLRP
jgi:hypothetical protein